MVGAGVDVDEPPDGFSRIYRIAATIRIRITDPN
jgi:hypothetical protein